MTSEEFGAWRDSHGLSQADMARVLGMSWSQVHRIDNGQCPVPGPVASICRVLDRHPHMLAELLA